MYSSTVLLFLLSSKFTYSMNTRQVPTAPQERTRNDQGTELLELRSRNEQEETELFPFTHPYTDDTKKFIDRMTHHFNITITGKVKLVMSFFPRFRKTRTDGCDTIEGSLVNDGSCRSKCVGQNRTYIKFMNKNISSILKVSFPPQQLSHRVKLNPIDSDTGSCVRKGRKFECSCTSNYQITTSISLINEVLDSIEKVNNNDNINITRNHFFSALLLILKFHPIAAPLFLADLFKGYNLYSERIEFDQSDFAGLNIEEDLENANNFVSENVAGVIDNKGRLVKKEEEIFQIIIHQVSSPESCELRSLGYTYLNKNELCEIWAIIVIFALGTYTLENFGKFFYESGVFKGLF